MEGVLTDATLEFLNALLSKVGEELVEEILDLKSEYSLSGSIFDIDVQIAKDAIR